MTGSDVVIYTVCLQSQITPASSTAGSHSLLLKTVSSIGVSQRSYNPFNLFSLSPSFIFLSEFTLAEVLGQNFE